MSFESLVPIVLQCLVLPAVLALFGTYLMSRCEIRDYWNDDEPVRGLFWPNVIGTFLCGIGMIVSDFWSRGIHSNPDLWRQWNAREPWMYMVWLIPAAMLVFALTKAIYASPAVHASMIWPVLTATAAAILWISLPQSDGYADQLPKVAIWLAVGVSAVAWNMIALSSIATSGGSRWNVLVLLAHLGCVACITLQFYASLGTWIVTGIGTTVGVAIVGMFHSSAAKQFCGWQLSAVVLPLEIMCITCLAASTFYAPEPSPLWMLGLATFLPTIVGVNDLFARRSNPWMRMLFAAILSAMILGSVVYVSMMNQPEW